MMMASVTRGVNTRSADSLNDAACREVNNHNNLSAVGGASVALHTLVCTASSLAEEPCRILTAGM
jgi:hypothetical protein